MKVRIIGVDCATQERKVGLASGIFKDGQVQIEDVRSGSDQQTSKATILDWMRDSKRTLLAIDAPLGWPESMGERLVEHSAGMPIYTHADDLFSRQTDRIVREAVGKRPMEVGAERIARTALWALKLLGEVRIGSGEAIPLAWESRLEKGTAAIEVYPAATLAAHGLYISGYKQRLHPEARIEMVKRLEVEAGSLKKFEQLRDSDDLLDAVACVLAGADFLRGEVLQPIDYAKARKEGWIWVRPKTGAG